MATFKPTCRVHRTPRSQTPADFDSVTFPLVLKYVGSKDWDTQRAIALNIKNYPFNGINLLKLKQKQREWQDLNPQHPRPKRGALSIELHSHKLVVLTGDYPASACKANALLSKLRTTKADDGTRTHALRMAYSDASLYITPANRFEIGNLRSWIEKTSRLAKRITRLELVPRVWKTRMLPLHHIRNCGAGDRN